MAIHSVGDLSRREILKMSAALTGSGVFSQPVRPVLPNREGSSPALLDPRSFSR